MCNGQTIHTDRPASTEVVNFTSNFCLNFCTSYKIYSVLIICLLSISPTQHLSNLASHQLSTYSTQHLHCVSNQLNI